MPTPNYLADDDTVVTLPPPDEDYAPPPWLNRGQVWQNPQTVQMLSPQDLSPIPGSAPPPAVSVPPPGVGTSDAGYADMMQSDVPPGLSSTNAIPAMQRIAGAGGPTLSGPPMPPGPDYGGLEKIYADYPQLTKPKWFQRLGGAAAGFGAGWSNAASRTKHPIDIPAMETDILHPGYREDVAQWQSRVAPAEKIAGLESQRQGAWWKNQELQSRAIRDQAYADYMKGVGRNGMVEVTDAIAKASGDQLKVGDRVPYTLVSHAMDIAGGKYAANQLQPVYSKRIAEALGVPVGTPQPVRVIDAVIHQITSLDKPGATRNMNAADVLLHPGDFDDDTVDTAKWEFEQEHRNPGAKPISRNTFVQIEKTKEAALARAEERARARIAAGEDASVVNIDRENDKQQAQNAYEGQISATEREPEHYEYPIGGAPTPPARPTQTTTPQATAPKPNPPAKPAQRITVKLPDGRFMTGTEDQFKEAGIQLQNRGH